MILNEATVPLGAVDCAGLAEAAMSLDEAAWHADTRRQNEFDVHAQTLSIIMLFCEGWPEVRISRSSGWDLIAGEALPIVDQVVDRHYQPGGVLLRAMLARLPAGARIARHRDHHASFSIAHRIHVPLVTNPQVEFIVGNEHVPPRPHFAFELNNLMQHQVVNAGDCDRIHFIFDYCAPADLDRAGITVTHTD